MKSLSDIAWNVPEEIYRKDPALSYSMLAKYEREGFNGLSSLFDHIETPSLTFGSAVDAIITGGQEEFNDRFMVADFPAVPDSVIKIVKALFQQYSSDYNNLNSIPDKNIIDYTNLFNYQLNWKPETRVKVIKEKGAEYYNLMYLAGNKTILDTDTYKDVCNAVDALKTSDATRWYFQDNNPFDGIERDYQLKFKDVLNNIPFRCMADLIITDNNNKVIVPCDLKTSSHYEWDFFKSFIEWNYIIQARLYWRLIRNAMDKDDYFRDFKLEDYRFIVVNRKSLTPLVWKCPYTQIGGTIYEGRNKQIKWRDPFAIGSELKHYLESNPKVPIGIDMDDSNDLERWIRNL